MLQAYGFDAAGKRSVFSHCPLLQYTYYAMIVLEHFISPGVALILISYTTQPLLMQRIIITPCNHFKIGGMQPQLLGWVLNLISPKS